MVGSLKCISRERSEDNLKGLLWPGGNHVPEGKSYCCCSQQAGGGGKPSLSREKKGSGLIRQCSVLFM